MSEITVERVSSERFGDLADLFCSNNATKGCFCTFFLGPRAEVRAGWNNGGNRKRMKRFVAEADPPMGLVAYRDGIPVGWCALGPRTRYPALIGPRATILAGRDPAEDDDVWLVPCFFVRVGHRRSGVMRALLDEAVKHARRSGAKAIEGLPIAGEGKTPDGYFGREALFDACGFERIAQPSPRRAVMRRELRRARRR